MSCRRQPGITTLCGSSPAAPAQTPWTLNLTKKFGTGIEKLLLTYVDHCNRWRRVTISYDCQGTEPASLEMDLAKLTSSREKWVEIYWSIHKNLHEIFFFDTVTHLRLETVESEPRIHVKEDIDESYSTRCETCRTTVINFLPLDSHLSGFVYKVKYSNVSYCMSGKTFPDLMGVDRDVMETIVWLRVERFRKRTEGFHRAGCSPFATSLEQKPA